MKAFVVVALLVASVAARSMDVDTLRLLKEKSLLKDELLFKGQRLGGLGEFQIPRKTFGMDYDYSTVGDVDTTNTNTGIFGGSSWGARRVTVLSFEELISTPLFREYYNIPLFRQFLEQHPVVFRRYIESVLFQQFWTIPTFQQYFRNPVFFYKYIVPQVQIVAQEIYPTEHTYNTVRGFGGVEGLRGLQFGGIEGHKTVDFFPESRREVVVGDYLNKLFSGETEQFNTRVPFINSRYFGEQINNNNNMYNQSPVQSKFILDKIYKTLFVDRPTVGEVTQVRTDVKVAPAHEKLIVEPITGETKVVLEDSRIVDVNVDQKIVPRTQVGSEVVVEGEVVKEQLLKKLILTKAISVEEYKYLITLPYTQVIEFLHQKGIFGDVTVPRSEESIIERHLVKDQLLKKLLLTKVISVEVYQYLITLPYTQVEEYLQVHGLFGEDIKSHVVLVKEQLLKKLLLNKVISVEVYQYLITLPYTQVEKYLERRGIFGDVTIPREITSEVVIERELVKEQLLKKLVLNKVISVEVYQYLITLPYTQVEKYLERRGLDIDTLKESTHFNTNTRFNQYDNIFGDRVVPTNTNTRSLRDLYNNFYGQQSIRGQVVDRFNRY